MTETDELISAFEEAVENRTVLMMNHAQHDQQMASEENKIKARAALQAEIDGKTCHLNPASKWGYHAHGWLWCSECEQQIRKSWNYCPRCGARIEGDE